jgi:hypothetical protein
MDLGGQFVMLFRLESDRWTNAALIQSSDK